MDEPVSRIINDAVAQEAKTRAGAPSPHNEAGAIAGFWIRVGADFLDALFLFVVGLVLSVPFHSTFARLGERGVFIGLAITMAYTDVPQSRFGGGRSWASGCSGCGWCGSTGRCFRSTARWSDMR